MSPRVLLAQITAPHMTAGIGIDVEMKTVCDAAPIVKYMVGWSADRVADYCYSRGWKVERVRAD